MLQMLYPKLLTPHSVYLFHRRIRPFIQRPRLVIARRANVVAVNDPPQLTALGLALQQLEMKPTHCPAIPLPTPTGVFSSRLCIVRTATHRVLYPPSRCLRPAPADRGRRGRLYITARAGIRRACGYSLQRTMILLLFLSTEPTVRRYPRSTKNRGPRRYACATNRRENGVVNEGYAYRDPCWGRYDQPNSFTRSHDRAMKLIASQRLFLFNRFDPWEAFHSPLLFLPRSSIWLLRLARRSRPNTGWRCLSKIQVGLKPAYLAGINTDSIIADLRYVHR
ncbi:hypothetical protein C8R47DRAFT_719638 [Mycena vitilis]|nr:hypothetical protein C8R47DRAFT_719638 [Mycena vitilis]